MVFSRRSFLLVGLLSLLFLEGSSLEVEATTNSNSNSNGGEQQQLRRKLQLQSETNVDNMTVDIDTIAYMVEARSDLKGPIAIAIAAALIIPVGIISVVAPGLLAALYVDEKIHRIPSTITFQLPTTTTIRDVSYDEEEDMMDATVAFYTALLETAYPTDFESFKLIRDRVRENDGKSNIFIKIIDRITGRIRNYGYTMKVDALVTVDDTDILTFGQVLTTISAGNMTSYVTNYLLPLEFNIFSGTELAIFRDRL